MLHFVLVKKIKAWIARDSSSVRLIYILSALITVAAVLLLGFVLWPARKPVSIESESLPLSSEEAEGTCPFRRGLDGLCVENEREIFPRLVAVMIENNIEARPLSGLGQASVVYEVPVEGHITRFLAIYLADTDVKKVGPIRSARSYYLDWVTEYGRPMYLHVGGSPDALDRLRQAKIFDLNEFSRGWYFWRSDDRAAPHDTYTASRLWQKAWIDYGESFASSTRFTPWSFLADNTICFTGCTTEITTTFHGQAYAATWRFNTSTEQYERFELGRPHRDRESGTPLVADTIIVQRVKTTVLDEVGRLRLDTIGEGEALVFHSGRVMEGRWRRVSGPDARTRWLGLTDAGGEEDIFLRSGKIWIVVVSQTGDVTWK